MQSTCTCKLWHDGHGTTVESNMAAQLSQMSLYTNQTDSKEEIFPRQHTPPPLPATGGERNSSTSLKVSSAQSVGQQSYQDELKARVAHEIKDMKEELCPLCFWTSFLLKPTPKMAPPQVPPSSLPAGDKSFKLTYAGSAGRHDWPPGSAERAHYDPLASLLNELVDNINQQNPHPQRRVKFVVYDKPMAPVSSRSLKPDLLLVAEEIADQDEYKWSDPIMAIEVKRDPGDALNQLGTYAREMLMARPGREVCWGMIFNQKTCGFQVVIFAPDRVHYTQPIKIKDAVGHRIFREVVMAILEQPHLLTIGENRSRDSQRKILPNEQNLEIQLTEFMRKTLTGRRTRVYLGLVVQSLVDVSGDRHTIPSRSPEAHGLIVYGSKDRNSSLLEQGDYILQELGRHPEEQIEFFGGRTALKIGEKLVIKESWPLEDRQNVEWRALTSCAGKFGLPQVVYRVTGSHPMAVSCTKDHRVPVQIAMKECGKRVTEVNTPRHLLQVLIHAIIGHWNLYVAEWLHRDVSTGNVLVLEDAIMKTAPNGLENSLEGLVECRGILIDGDAMIETQAQRRPGIFRSCTQPFLSRRLVHAWGLDRKTYDQYHDDLESFAWVLFVASIQIAEKKNLATRQDKIWINLLIDSDNDLIRLYAGKVSIASEIADLAATISQGQTPAEPTSFPDAFVEILHQWFTLIKGYSSRDPEKETFSSSVTSTGHYADFILFAWKRLDLLPDKWILKAPPGES